MDDKDRPLNPRGRASAPLMAGWLAKQEWIPDTILCSTAVRTTQTLELMIENWKSLPSDSEPEIHFMDELYLAPAATLVSIASKYATRGSILVLAHNPGMEDAASFLSRVSTEMPTAAIAVFEAVGRSWPADWLNVESWKLRSLVKPRELAD
jgi:phosphohistidine phosphatase